MNQSTHIKIPTPLHAQLKVLAVKRGTTMVEVIHGVVRDAIEKGELKDEVPGLKVRLELNLDTEDHGPHVIITTPNGDLPPMTREDAEAIACYLSETEPGSDITGNRINKGGHWKVGFVGTSVKLSGQAHGVVKPVEIVLTPAIARDFARQVRRAAEGAVHDINC